MIAYQKPLVDPRSDWKPTPVSELPSWKGVKRIGLDSETYDPDIGSLGPGIWREGTYVAGVSFAFEDGPEFYLPVRHAEDNLPEEEVWRYLVDQAKEFDGTLVGANLGGYDMPMLGVKHGVRFPKVKRFADVQNSAPICDERHWSFKLDDVLTRAGIPGKNEDSLRDAMIAWGLAVRGTKRPDGTYPLNIKKNIAKIAARHAALYAIDDARRPLECLRVHEHEIEEQDLWQAWDLECEVLPALVRMYERGILIDQNHLEEVDEWALAELAQKLHFIRRKTGVDLGLCVARERNSSRGYNVNKKPAQFEILSSFGVREEDLPLTDGGKKAVKEGKELTLQHREMTADVFAALDNPVGDAMARVKKLDKLRGTFVSGIRSALTSDGRCHTQYNQTKRQEADDADPTGAVTFRFSSKGPNLQNQPSRDDFAAYYKHIFLPEPGMLLAKLDYSSQEPRFMCHYGVRAGIESAIEMAARYRENPDLDTYLQIGEFAGVIRDTAKTILLAQAYGQSGGALCLRLGLEREQREIYGKLRWVAGKEGQALIDKINEAAPYVQELAKNARAYAQANGYVRECVTAGRLRLPEKYNKSGWDYCHKAFNKKVQGGAAKQTKRAFVELDRVGALVHLQVHDELVPSVTGPKQAKEYAEIMMNCVPLEVPSMVEVLIGANWGSVKKVEA